MSTDPTANERIAESIVDAVARRHGDDLREGDLDELRSRLRRAAELLAALDRVPLRNDDEPDLVFRVADEARPPRPPRS